MLRSWLSDHALLRSCGAEELVTKQFLRPKLSIQSRAKKARRRDRRVVVRPEVPSRPFPPPTRSTPSHFSKVTPSFSSLGHIHIARTRCCSVSKSKWKLPCSRCAL